MKAVIYNAGKIGRIRHNRFIDTGPILEVTNTGEVGVIENNEIFTSPESARIREVIEAVCERVPETRKLNNEEVWEIVVKVGTEPAEVQRVKDGKDTSLRSLLAKMGDPIRLAASVGELFQ